MTVIPDRILIVDDNEDIRLSVSTLMDEFGYDVRTTANAEEGIDVCRTWRPAVVITDIRMQGMTGLDMLAAVHKFDRTIPVILMTAYPDFDAAINAVRKGAFDFITKPFNPVYLAAAVRKAVALSRLVHYEKKYRHTLEAKVREKTAELERALALVKKTNSEMIRRLSMAAEYRDYEGNGHIRRIGLYAGRLAAAAGLAAETADMISLAGMMHDIGKVGIPERILLKERDLDRSEFEIMKSHTVIGGTILGGSDSPLVEMARRIALTHHERWDGTGYPDGLRGDAIPVESRIVLICDRYDAMRSRRPYKEGMTHAAAVAVLTGGDAKSDPGHFAPDVLDAFREAAPAFEAIYGSNQ